MKTCANCGAKLDDNAKFCAECGTKQVEQKRFCTNCGEEIPSGANFCAKCGTRVSVDSPVPTTAAEPESDLRLRKKADDYIKQGGIIEYNTDETDEIKKIFSLIAGPEYVKNEEAAQELRKMAKEWARKGKLTWTQYCEYGRDPKRYDPDDIEDTYEGEIDYALVNDEENKGKWILILRGDGDMPDIPSWNEQINMEDNYWVLNEEIKDKKFDITKVVILGEIECIGARCFEGFNELNVVSLPDTITTIDEEAFSGCQALKYITMPKSIDTIEEKAFASTGLKCLFIPESIDEIESYAFGGSVDLDIAFVPDNCDYSDSSFEEDRVSSVLNRL